jgi:hypothetical protein
VTLKTSNLVEATVAGTVLEVLFVDGHNLLSLINPCLRLSEYSPAKRGRGYLPMRLSGRVVMQRTANPRTSVQFRPRPPLGLVRKRYSTRAAPDGSISESETIKRGTTMRASVNEYGASRGWGSVEPMLPSTRFAGFRADKRPK